MGGRSSNSWIVSKGIYGCDGSPTLRFLLVRLFLFFSLSCGMILIPGPPPCSGPPPAASRKGRPRKEKTKHFFFPDIKSLVSKTTHFFSLLSTFLFFALSWATVAQAASMQCTLWRNRHPQAFHKFTGDRPPQAKKERKGGCGGAIAPPLWSVLG